MLLQLFYTFSFLPVTLQTRWSWRHSVVLRINGRPAECSSTGAYVNSNLYSETNAFTIFSHYDVIPASPKGWSSDPFTLYALNGYLYGRGVTDNKGPIMAIACAAAALLRRRALDVDLVMLIEGEEEAGSKHFAQTVKQHKVSLYVSTHLSYPNHGLRF